MISLVTSAVRGQCAKVKEARDLEAKLLEGYA